MSRAPENSWTVPEVPSPPTASGLNWHGNLCFPAYDSTMFVPEITSLQNSQNQFAIPSSFKRRRREYWGDNKITRHGLARFCYTTLFVLLLAIWKCVSKEQYATTCCGWDLVVAAAAVASVKHYRAGTLLSSLGHLEKGFLVGQMMEKWYPGLGDHSNFNWTIQ